MRYLVSIVFLIFLSFIDIRKRKVPIWAVILGILMAVTREVFMCVSGKAGWSDPALGALPGILMLLLAKLTGKVGYGDGWILLELGLVFGYQRCLFLLCVALMLLSCSVIVLLFLRKVRRNSEIPFLPYLTLALVLDGLFIQGGG